MPVQVNTEEEYEDLLDELWGLLDRGKDCPLSVAQQERLDALLKAEEAYADEHYRIDPPEPGIRCSSCFDDIDPGDRKGVVYTPFGGPYALEEPEALFICGFCWTSATEEAKQLIRSIAYSGPHPICGEESDGEQV
jgi:hypothetical protein